MDEKLSYKQIALYGLPGLPLAMLGLPLFIYLPSFYNQEIGLSLSAVGLVLLLARSFDVITDPMIGFLNDRFPKFKPLAWRRKSYILAGIPLLILGLNFLLKPDENVSASYLFIWSFITYLGWTLINIPWLAMGAEMSTIYHEKSNLASSREVFAVVGTITVISIPVILSLQSNLTATLHVLANLLTVLIPLALIPLIWKVRLLDQQSQHIAVEKPSSSMLAAFSKQNIKIIKHPAIKKLLPAYFINSIANALPATLFILYASYVIQSPEKIGVLLISYFLCAIVGIPFWLYLAQKTDKHTSWRYALIGSILGFIWVPFIGQGDSTAFLLVCIATGFCLGADVVMPSSIQADISQKIAADELQQKLASADNKNPTALLFGIWGMLTKLSLALAIGIAFPLLDLAGLDIQAGADNISSHTGVITLIILYALIPIILKIWVVFQMRNYSFDQNYFATQPSLHKETSSKGKRNENINSKNVIRPIPITPTTKRMQ